MAFAAGDKVLVTVQLGDGSQLTRQPGLVRTVLAGSMYQGSVIGLILTLPESDLTKG